MKKRILTFILAITMLFAINVGAALRGTACEEEAGLLEAIGVLENGELDSLDENRKISRKEFAEYLVKAAGIIPITETTAFTDYTAEGAISNAAVSGIISGHDDGSFKPGDNILVAEAVKMAVEAMRLDILMLNKNYPTSYMNIASERKLLKNVNGNSYAEMTVSDAVHLLYNMINTAVPTVGEELSEIVFDDDITLLKERFGIIKATGVVSGNEVTRLSSSEGIKSQSVEINNIVYSVGNTNAAEYLGYKVNYYYTEEESEIVYITYADKVSDIILYSNEIEEFKNNTYYYLNYEGSQRSSKAELAENADIIYNGKALTGITDPTVYTPEYGYVVLVDNDNDSEYEVLFIYDVTVVAFNMFNTEEGKLFGKYTFDNYISLKTDEEGYKINISDSRGNKMEIEELQQGDILEVVQSEDKEYIEITVYRNSVTVTVNGTGTNDKGELFIKSGGKEYVIEKTLKAYMSEKGIGFEMGKEYICYTDGAGRIAGYEESENKETGGYGYLITVRPDDVEEDKFYAKIMTSEGVIKTFIPAPKVRIDGENVKPDAAYEILGGIVSEGQSPTVCWYETNAEGDLKLVDTPQKGTRESFDSLHVKGITNNENYNNGAKTVGGKVNFDNDSLVFTVPSDSTVINEQDYSVAKPAEAFVHYNPYTVTGYARSRKSPFSKVALYVGQAAENIVNKADVLLVQGIRECLNSEEEIVNEITVLSPNGEKTYLTEDSEVVKKAKPFYGSGTVEVKVGDVIRVSENLNGEISTVQVIYSPTEDKLYIDKNPTNSNIPYPFTDEANLSKYYVLKSDFGNTCRITMGNVFYKSDGYLRVVNPIFDLSKTEIVKSIENGEISLENYQAVNIFKYEKGKKVPYRKADISEIYDYDTTKMASRVLIRTNDALTKIIVIY